MGDLLGKLNRAQHSRLFKIIATVLVLVAAVATVATYAVAIARERENLPFQQVREGMERDVLAAAGLGTPAGDAAKPDPAREAAAKALRESAQTMARSINSILERRLSLTAFGLAVAMAAAILLTVIWLGLALTYLAILAIGSAVCVPMFLWGSPWWRGLATFITGGLALAMAFSALVQAARVALSPAGPITAIAHNVINEAVRLKISLVFVVMLILALAALPGALDAGSPLRYRVQAFLAYGCEGAFWIIAILVLFLSCATVAFEQRDKIIWQTMTKPVKPWEYVLGKWLGVFVMAGVLLGVSTSGVFLFTEYLRNQPAQGEIRPFLPGGYQQGETITQDRLLLETQVLTARKSIAPSEPELDPQGVAKEIEARVQKARQSDPQWLDTPDARAALLAEFRKEFTGQWMTVAPGDGQRYVFKGLKYAKDSSSPVTLRFKVNAGGNMPTDTYKLTFGSAGIPPFVLETRLDQFMSEPLPPLAIELVKDPITGETDGQLTLDVFNGDAYQQLANKESLTFPAGALEVSFPVGDFRANYLRAMLMLWLKLGFLAMVGVAAGTFLSFPVAALTAFGVFLCAEGAGFLGEALQSYDAMDGTDFVWYRVPIVYIAHGVTRVFWFYSNLQPIEHLAEGRVVTWLNVATATAVIGGLTGGLWALGAAVFRKRELAIYSGQ